VVSIHHITLSRTQLDIIPEDERRSLILLAHAANEINILAKLFHFSARASSETPILMQAENAQALVLGRLLSGKIYEFWKLLQSTFFRSAHSKRYQPQFDDVALKALKSFKSYFSHENIIATVRNKFAFHYATDQIDTGYQALEEGDSLEIYLAKQNVNSLYAFGDTIVGRAMLESIKPGDHQEAFGILIRDTSQAVSQIDTIIGAIIAICFETHIGPDLYAMGAKIIEIEGAPDSQKVGIPYFIEIVDDNDT
jgi:hypothetical protein